MTKKPDSKLERIFGSSPHFKVLSHLWMGHDFDYSVADIKDATGVSRPTIKGILKLLVEEEVIVESRVLKNSQRYQFNKEKKEYFYLLNLIIHDAKKVITQDAMGKYSNKKMQNE